MSVETYLNGYRKALDEERVAKAEYEAAEARHNAAEKRYTAAREAVAEAGAHLLVYVEEAHYQTPTNPRPTEPV